MKTPHDDSDTLADAADTADRAAATPARGLRAGQFRKGASGNPNGRPRGRKGRVKAAAPVSAFDILFEATTVTQDGTAEARPFEEVLQLRTYQDALAGNKMARREVIRMILAREQALAKTRTKKVFPSVERKIEGPDPRNADQVMLLLGIATFNPDRPEDYEGHPHILLQTWATQMALSRRRGGKPLIDQDRAEIIRSTSGATGLHWPRGSRP